MSSEWTFAPLESCLEALIDYRGKTPEKTDSGIPLITAKIIKRGRIEKATEFIAEDNYASWMRRGIPKEGDIVLTVEAPLGEVAQLGSEKIALAQRVVTLRGKEGVLDNTYLLYLLQTEEMLDQLKARATGTTVLGIKQSELRKVPLSLPPIAQQRSAASILKTLDDRLTLLRETNATLETIAQSLFKSWFVDFDPVRAKAEGFEPEGMDAATAALFPDSLEESELGAVPRGWRVDRADCWLSVLETGRRPKGGVSGIMGGVPSIGAESIVRIGKFDYSKTKYVSAEFFEKMKSGGLQSHDVLLYKDGGKPGVFLPRVSMFGDGFPFEKCGINEHVFRIRLKEPFSQVFLYYWLWSDAVMHELKHRGGKAAIPGINQSDVKELKLLVPDTHTLMRFDEITSPLISTIFSNSKHAQTLTQLRDTLLPRLISGQLRLPEAEVAIETVLSEAV